ncbi:hypothetical protein LOK49_LG05G00045 [Camellia lanceoleosa]|uniref:Uncharacterized protein n=1 Tax=Camellia lanceoleosa TaxID=1840588 RepID=A0ACC0HNR7_9ERIC|nr:hypothetical protein LOK49_LG05G00045 [Camellia lanceoleosa]
MNRSGGIRGVRPNKLVVPTLVEDKIALVEPLLVCPSPPPPPPLTRDFELLLPLLILFLRQPPPRGTLLRAPPLVQRLQRSLAKVPRQIEAIVVEVAKLCVC